MSDKRTLGESVPEGAWRKFHKVTPLANGGVLWVALAIFLYNILQSLLEDGVDELRDAASHITLMWILIAAGALVLLTIVVVVCSWVVWRFASFAVVDSGIHHRSGVLIKRHKHMRWDRVQSVEVEQKIFGRIFGFGSVKVESAGSDEGITLGLLTMADCAALRKEVLQGLANARAGRPIGLANDAVAPASTAPAATLG
uniref:PH domain-containing protein n=1 Tax=Trueperella bernardiae TaxID=59561 RepID=UPI0028899761